MSLSEPIEQILPDLAALEAFGRELGRQAAAGDIICLYGPLGAGKTTLTRAIAAGLEVPPEQPVTSPTFALIHEHQGRLPLFHLDLYRLGGDEDELLELGIEDYLYGDGVCVIEWPERLGGLLPARHLDIRLAFAVPPAPETSRIVTVHRGH
ncbi:tRNA (adenosine(37)-N6)-threonylcarbamoyltransferase complex ATPase subunit type 1 TsaE [Desulfurivibrio alkaliphilus]|uniref:tRNA threonylcarbamoyladenosine biosynthesis protein TsaE n=1 Tax=Desulfurivibrio alkaliphilus (strain DSM 19089 / UNIQEM U267 / AHT2) TaxID=589865 RepID=D6Z3B2_DESAT|nr:tRNA (adenosine(37)-N6)-threonylcarbamoyltransferase complex ATPase subunit type 1 TsaE [Desulfurivibrio alkaliphilus]ADH86037.1 protein of unknown function UPF0079 [Desulfurivibrio alkaliphilus AHT 2]